MPASKAQQKAVHKYTKENYDRFLIAMKPKGRLDIVKAHAEAQGESANGFINRAIQEAIERDTGAAGGPHEALGEHVDELTTSIQPVPKGTLKAAREAAELAGETVAAFIARAVETQMERDVLGRKMKGG